MSFTYIPNQTVLCDFCNSNDTAGINNLYDTILSAFNQAGVNVVAENRTCHSIAIQIIEYWVVVITMRLKVGFGVCVIGDGDFNKSDFESKSSDSDMDDLCEGVCVATYEKECCPIGIIRHGDGDQNNSYGYKSDGNKRANYAADGLGRKGLSRNIPLCEETNTQVGYMRCYSSRFNGISLPCYGYGRVTVSVMCKDTGWALYLHQTRPYHAIFDPCPDSERYGFSSVIFCDKSNTGHNVVGWMMPQPPAPKSLTRNMRPVSDMSFAVFYMYDYISPTDTSYCIQRYGTNKDMWIDVHGSECSRVGQYVDFLTSNSVQSAPIILHEFDSGLEIEGSTVTENEVIIDPEIISRANVTYNGKIYKSWSVLNSENQPRRTRSDGSVWEWGGNGFLHRVQ